MVESSVPVEITYDVSFEMKKHFTPSELTGKSPTPINLRFIYMIKYPFSKTHSF